MATILPASGEPTAVAPPKSKEEILDLLGAEHAEPQTAPDGSVWWSGLPVTEHMRTNPRARAWWVARGGPYAWWYGTLLILSREEAESFGAEPPPERS